MLLVLKCLLVAGDVAGVICMVVAYRGFKKLLREHKKISDSEYVSEDEQKRQSRYIRILLLGFLISIVTSVINLILLFIK